MRLSSHDASFLYSETASGPMHGVGIVVVEGGLSYEDYVAFTQARIHLVPRYRQRLMFVPGNVAHPKWVDDPYFDLSNHIVKYETAEGATLQDVIDIALELGESLLDRSRPLWKQYVFEGVQGNTVLALMAHHAMVDGASGIEIGTVMSDVEPSPPPPPVCEERWRPAQLQTPWELFLEAQHEAAGTFSASLTRSTTTADEALVAQGNAITQRLMTEPVITAPWNASPIGPKRKLAYSRHKLSQYKRVRKSIGGTINDIVLAIVSESAARYLTQAGETVANRHMRLMCPVDVREEGDTDPGNKVSALYPLLPAWPMPMGERLLAVRHEMDKLKSANEAAALHAVMNASAADLSPMLMYPTLSVGSPFDPTALAAQFPPPVPPRLGPRPPYFGFNFTCSNVPGIPVQTYVDGHKVLFVVGTMMIGGLLGLGVSCVSGNGEMFISITSDPRLVPDVDKLKTGVDDALAELLDLSELVVLAKKEAAAKTKANKPRPAKPRVNASQRVRT